MNGTALRIEYVKPDTLRVFDKNPRKITAEARSRLKRGIEAFGLLDPIIARRRDRRVLGGHQRLDVAGELGLPKVPVVFVGHLTNAQADALTILLNNPAAQGEWDMQRLADLVAGLGPGFDATLTGFDAVELKAIWDPAGGAEDVPGPLIDQAAELREKWQTVPGQLWEIGQHRLLCGDATNAQDVARVLGAVVPFLCVTDPPYGVEYDPNWRNVEAAKGHLAYAPTRVGKVLNDDRADWREAWVLFPGDVIYSWHPAGATSLVHAAALQDSGFVIRMQIIWAKSNFPIGRGDYHVQHEPCWYGVRKGRASRRTDDRTQTTKWEINLDRNVEGGHSTQKPLECMARPIRNHDAPEVYDPFLGSGTTMVAAARLHRRCYGLEIEPKYVAVILERLSGLGLKPELVP